jgi:predicted ATPase/DNA-binding winged helix-turn-helix (wHTH) protein
MNEQVSFGPFRLDLGRKVLLRDGMPVSLGGRALDLLCVLAGAKGELVTKDAILESVWPGRIVDENNIQAQVATLRRALDDGPNAPNYVLTVPGRGYRFVIPGDGEHRAPIARGNLPKSPVSLIGRETELTDLAGLVGQCRLLTLVGAGGMGKTRLALELGAGLHARFPDGVWLVELAPLGRSELLGETVAALFNLSPQGERSAPDVIADFLGARRLLLILDNCEHVIVAAAEFAQAVLARCPNITMLTTSREPLAIPGEHIYETPQLRLPPPGPITGAEALNYSSVELLVTRAAAASAQFALTDGTAPLVAEICRRLDGMPLALELAAARLRLLSPGDLLERLDDCLHLLTTGSRTALPRHRTLRALVDWSHALLSPPEQALLRRLSVFAGSFSLAAATAVTAGPPVEAGNVLDLLAKLVDKSLVVPLPGTCTRRYRLLETTRAFALERLAASSEADWPSRLCAYVTELFGDAERSWPTTATTQWLAGLETDLDNLRAALTWALRPEGEPARGLVLLGRTHWFWCELPLLREQRRWFELAATFIGPMTPPDVEGRIRLALGWDPYFGDRSRLPNARRAEALFRHGDDHPMLAQALMHAGRAASRYRDVAEAMACFNEALALLRPRGPSKLLALLLLSMATSHKHAGEVDIARSCALEGLAMSAKLEDIQTRDMCFVQLASIAFEAGDLGEAIDLARESLERCRRSPFMRNHFVAVQWLAGFLLLNGDLDAGRTAALEAFALSRALGNVNLLDSVDQLALIAAAQADEKQAARLCGYADAYANRYGISRYRISLAMRDRLLQRLSVLTCIDRSILMEQGANWSEEQLLSAVHTI